MRNSSTPGLVYSGERDGAGFAIVRVNGAVLRTKQATEIYRGGSDSFEWGYCGSGPRLLAVGLLYDYLADATQALRYSLVFSDKVISNFAQNDGWSLTGEQIQAFVNEQKL